MFRVLGMNPIARATRKSMTRSYFRHLLNRSSDGFAPLRMLSMYTVNCVGGAQVDEISPLRGSAGTFDSNA